MKHKDDSNRINKKNKDNDIILNKDNRNNNRNKNNNNSKKKQKWRTKRIRRITTRKRTTQSISVTSLKPVIPPRTTIKTIKATTMDTKTTTTTI